MSQLKQQTTTETTPNADASITKVHFSERGAYKYLSGNREPITIRIDTGLYKAFKPVAKRVYGSVCRAVEVYITTLIEATETGVHFSNTEKPINIDKIVIERRVRTRRALEVEEETTVTKVVACCGFCHKVPVVAVFRNNATGIEKKVCSYHYDSLFEHPKWKVVSVGTKLVEVM